VREPSAAEVEVTIRKLKKYKAPGSDQIPAELIQAGWGGGHCVLRYINLLCLSGTKKNCLTSGKSQLSYQFTKRVIKLTAVIIEAYNCCQLHTKFYLTFFSLG
jgi:hypothetical protein